MGARTEQHRHMGMLVVLALASCTWIVDFPEESPSDGDADSDTDADSDSDADIDEEIEPWIGITCRGFLDCGLECSGLDCIYRCYGDVCEAHHDWARIVVACLEFCDAECESGMDTECLSCIESSREECEQALAVCRDSDGCEWASGSG